MNKKIGEPVLIDGKKVTAGTTFVAEKAEGSVEVVFEFERISNRRNYSSRI